PTTTPLQLLIFRHPDDLDILRYEEAVLRAFQGGKEAGPYLATGDDLGIQSQLFSAAPPLDPGSMLNSVCHTLTLVLVDHALLGVPDAAFWEWLERCWSVTKASNGRHAMLV